MTKVDPYLHAVLLLHGAGKEVSEANIVSVLGAAGVQADNAKAKVLAEAVKDVSFEELLKNATVVAAAPAAAAPAAGGEAKEAPKEEDTSKKEEQAAEGLANLFG
ncbi:50S ribosomal protein P1 [Candidatus Micrarchaeota archaeon]|nr:50S ribosomal protein P1 [Candidatus Micrarchaeota archaeon]